MSCAERLQLARGTYRAAVDRARRQNTPAAWRRLVRAGRNLRATQAEARGELEHHLPRPASRWW